MAEEISKASLLSGELEVTGTAHLQTFIAKIANVFKKQFESYNGKKGLGLYLGYVYHEGIQLGMRLEIVKRHLKRRL